MKLFCVKCGTDGSAGHLRHEIEFGTWIEAGPGSFTKSMRIGQAEELAKLRVECFRCGYQWLEPCLDAIAAFGECDQERGGS